MVDMSLKHTYVDFYRLATDFDFIAYMSKMAFFLGGGGGGGGGGAFSRQWRFWNMVSMIFAVLYDILHCCNLPL